MLCLVAQSCLTFCSPMDCSPPGSSVHEDSPGKNTGVDCHDFLQGIFPTQGLNPGLLHCRWILYHLSHQGSLKFLLVGNTMQHVAFYFPNKGSNPFPLHWKPQVLTGPLGKSNIPLEDDLWHNTVKQS